MTRTDAAVGHKGGGRNLPWWVKIAAKLILARLPVSNDRWARMAVFRHGRMSDPRYAERVYRHHIDRCGGARERVVLELGPGDSLFTAVFAAADGATRTLLVDVAQFARADFVTYVELADSLGLSVPPRVTDTSDLLAELHADYLTNGLQSLRELPPKSVDVVFSNAVLEHLLDEEFDAIICELARILKPSGMMSHRIDLKDHLGGGLNNLRFSRWVWESRAFRTSGFYTNRRRLPDLERSFNAARLDVVSWDVDRWAQLPLDPGRLHPDFRRMDPEDLLVSGCDVALRLATR